MRKLKKTSGTKREKKYTSIEFEATRHRLNDNPKLPEVLDVGRKETEDVARLEKTCPERTDDRNGSLTKN
jgi:hypothetical protein